jgi:hypothetical protein
MRVALGTFARSGLEDFVAPDLGTAVNAALAYHVDRTSNGRGAVKFPMFLSAPADVGGARHRAEAEATAGPQSEVEVEVDEQVEAAIRRDATRQGITATELAGHAVLAYLANLDLVDASGTARSWRRTESAEASPPRFE